MEAPLSDESDPGPERGGAVVAGTVEGRTVSPGTALAIVVSLAVVAFLAGLYVSTSHSSDVANESQSVADLAPNRPDSGSQQSHDAQQSKPPGSIVQSPNLAQMMPVGHAATGTGSDGEEDPHSGKLRYQHFADPLLLLSSITDPAVGNSVGLNVADLGASVRAVMMNLRVVGSAGSTVAIHKGDRPDQAIRLVIPPTGTLVVSHLLAAVDEAGRLVISADSQVDIEAVGIGSYLAVEHSAVGRFVSAGSVQIGSLVTAVDGRSIVLSLGQVPGLKPVDVGQAVLRLNANVGSSGGTVAIATGESSSPEGAAPIVTWPAPSTANLGLGGTALILVTPDAAGQITLNYLGGSVLTVDLVGYYTSDAAPVSASGLLVLETPVLQELDSEATDEVADIEDGGVLLLTTTNGPVSGPVAVASDPLFAADRPIYNLAANQVRSTTIWIDANREDLGPSRLSAPAGAVVSWWRIATISD